MRFDLHPLIGAGPLTFGLPRTDVRRILSSPYREFFKSADSPIPTDDFGASDLHVYYDVGSLCSGIEFWPGAELRLHERPVLELPARELLAWLSELDPATIYRDSLILSECLGISLYAPELEDEPDLPVESAYVFLHWG